MSRVSVRMPFEKKAPFAIVGCHHPPKREGFFLKKKHGIKLNCLSPTQYTTLYEPSWILLDVPCLPPVLEMHSCTDVQLPPLSYNTFTCSGDLWGVLACVGILPTTRHWNILEPPGTYTTLYEPSWIILDAPCPQYLKRIAALMCSYPPPFIQHIKRWWELQTGSEQRESFNVQIFLVASKWLLHLCFEN